MIVWFCLCRMFVSLFVSIVLLVLLMLLMLIWMVCLLVVLGIRLVRVLRIVSWCGVMMCLFFYCVRLM